MNVLEIIEEYLAGSSAVEVLTRALEESSFSQIRKQKPWLAPLLDYLRNQSLKSKYIPWVVNSLSHKKGKYNLNAPREMYTKDPDKALRVMDQLVDIIVRDERRSQLQTMIDLSDRFDKALNAKKFDKAIQLGLLKNPKTKDIMFWIGNVRTNLGSGDALGVLDTVLERLGGLQSRGEIKVNEADLIYKDKRFTVYSPLSNKASCQLGAGTKWCIASKRESYFDDYTQKGVAFAFIMDAAGMGDMYKIAVVYDLSNQNIDEYYDAADDSIPEKSVKGSVGAANWNTIKSKILQYMKTRKIDIKRKDGEYWAGDYVEFETDYSDQLYNRLYDDVREYWLDPRKWGVPFSMIRALPEEFYEIVQNKNLVNSVHDALYSVFAAASGKIVAPTRTIAYEDDPFVRVKGELGEYSTDWDEATDEFFPVPEKPKKPKDIDKQLVDQYLLDLKNYEDAVRMRKAFEKGVVKRIKILSGGEWDEDVSVHELKITHKIDPWESIQKYGPVD